MLDLTSRPAAPEREHAYLRREYVTRSDIAHFVRRNASTIGRSILVSLAAAVLYVLLAQPLFTARVQLLIDPKLPQPLRESPSEPSYYLDSPQVDSQIAVLRSEGLALAVIKKLGLLEDPEFQAGRQSGLLTLLGRIFEGNENAVRSEDERNREAIARFENGLDVRRVGVSYAIDIFYTARVPEEAARIANATAEAYLQSLLDTRAEAAKVGGEWLEERVRQLRAQMNDAARRAQGFKASQDYRILKKSDRSAVEPSGQEPPRAAEEPTTTLDELEATAQTYRKIYESFYQAFAETVQRESYPVSNARIISKATIPNHKSHPKTKLILALAALVGTLAGFGIALVKHSLDETVRSSQQVREAIGLECLGLVPQLGMSSGETFLVRTKRAVRRFIGAEAESDDYAYALSAVIDNPFSPFSDGVKRLKRAVSLSKVPPLRCIGITSALAGEGKSTIAANLAAQFAASGVRTLLIDADVRNATLSYHLAPSAEQGILEAIKAEVGLERFVVAVESMGFDLLPVAIKTELAEDGDLLVSEKMSALLNRLGETYGMIIVDLPPLRLVAESITVSALVDGVIVVAEWEVTPLPVLADEYHSLRKAQANVLGAVITKVNVSAIEGSQHPYYNLVGR
jgi:capsular exopolysaccharide synthesis family protein